MKKILVRIMRFVANEVRKIIAVATKNKNLETDAYLYDMATVLRKDLGVTRRNSQYILHTGSNPICILNENKAIHVIDMNRFQKIKIGLMRIGGTPKKAYDNIDELFESKKRNYNKPIAVTIKR